ncbi:relaxase/mobilization nuclease domain-containing protein [Micrococcus luteus]|uniref:relaxase/mobilization nuclease domain-containing protein n=1 Tax=Micrococcus luteus TaxID=1270 RepID=UPI003D346E15
MAQPIAAIVVASPTRNTNRLIAYAMNRKQGQTTDRFVAASGINGAVPEVAAHQFRDNRKRHGKNGERQVQVSDGEGGTVTVTEGAYVQGYHVIQSFARDGEGALDPSDPDAWEEAHRLGRKLGRRLAGDGRMAVVVTQIDGATGCIHNHIVLDSIDRQSGKSFASSNVKHKMLAATHDEVLAEAGYVQQNELQSTAAERREPSEDRALLKHQQWVAGGRQGPEPYSVAVVKHRIREAQRDPRSVSFDTYAGVLLEHGVRVEKRGEKGAGLTYEMVLADGGGGVLKAQPAHRRRASKLGRDFMLPAVEAACARNRAREVGRLRGLGAPVLPPREESAVEALLRELTEARAKGRAKGRAGRRPGPTKAPAAPPRTPEPREPAEASQAAQRADQAQQAAAVAAPVQSSAWRSRLWDLPPSNRTVRTQQIIDAVAEWEPSARERLQSGERLDEPAIPKGVGARFLESYGQYLDPAVRTELEAREETRAQRREQFELEREHEEALQAAGRRPEAERTIYERGVRAQLDTARLRREAIEAAIAEGRYGRMDVDGIVSPAEQAEREASARRREQVAERAAAMQDEDRESDDPQPGD